ncbi:MAG TPA: VOC family protein [Acidimicrobiales bacterium]
MSLQLANIVFDCDQPPALAEFWSQVLSRPVDPDGSEYFVSIGAGGDADAGPAWFFAKVPEPKTAKNRCHVDLHAPDRDAVQTEVDRLLALGATLIRAPKEEFGAYWATLQDPEGNELCIGAP